MKVKDMRGIKWYLQEFSVSHDVTTKTTVDVHLVAYDHELSLVDWMASGGEYMLVPVNKEGAVSWGKYKEGVEEAEGKEVAWLSRQVNEMRRKGKI